MHCLLKINSCPVVHGILARHTAKADYSEFHQVPVGQRENQLLWILYSRLLAINVRIEINNNNKEYKADDRQMVTGSNIIFNHQVPKSSTREPGYTPYCMEARHNRMLVHLLYTNRLCVERQIQEVSG